MCLRTRAKECLRQGIKYVMVLLFVKVKNILFYDQVLFFFFFLFDICPLPWADEPFFCYFALW